ncbi:stage V sporulation protein AB [Alteribacillus sp. YIM 98480]|uniref:stage V sporulation protein AB n=1 Tax=Alteribacillus sp. YIM 98480 TaxID=2606599 RepID=UPI00131BAF96|nr:stage V sporulation protein AB [Alteribacillus sp. YIM 98480]
MAVEALFAILIGLSGGLAVGSGFVAFITVLGIIPRLVQLTKTQKAIQAYEIAVITGAVIGSIATLHDIKGTFPALLTIPVGLAAGMFVGMLAAALTEVLNVFPILARRIGMEKNIIVLVMAIVFGKILGSLFHWIFFVKF